MLSTGRCIRGYVIRNYNIRGQFAGVYAVLLTAEDRAGNAQTGRRFLIFDNRSSISVNTNQNKQLRVNSAVEKTSYVWVTSEQDSNNAGEKVIYSSGITQHVRTLHG